MSTCSNDNTVKHIVHLHDVQQTCYDCTNSKKKKKMCLIAHFEGACEQTSFFKLFCWGVRKKNSQPCIVLSVYKVSQSVFLRKQPV